MFLARRGEWELFSKGTNSSFSDLSPDVLMEDVWSDTGHLYSENAPDNSDVQLWLRTTTKLRLLLFDIVYEELSLRT